nr:transcriptional regulator [uncultured Acinetobacter sp.]
MQLFRVTYNQRYELLGIPWYTWQNLILKDSTFPKLYKHGSYDQIPFYFYYGELVYFGLSGVIV